MNNIVILNEFLENDNIVQHIRQVVLELAEPINIHNNLRHEVPRNQDYFENTISNYEGNLFVQHFRMTRGTFQNLLQTLANVRPIGNEICPFEKKVLFSIWVLAKPESFLAAGDRFGLAKSSAHNYFKDVISRILLIMPQVIVWPQNYQEAIQVFLERSHVFPGVVGAVDGCHIFIKQPQHNANDYYNRMQSHSIILQGICDHRMAFIDISVGMPGRCHDARVFRESAIWRQLTQEMIIPPENHILGDSAYPLMLNVLTPYRDNGHLTDVQLNYNYKLSIIRSVIERAFARLKGKFRRLKYLDVGSPDFGSEIIAAACVLHNFIIFNDNDDYNDIDNEYNIPQPNNGINDENERNEKRDAIANLIY